MIGLKVNNYEIVSLLGEGGMGAVYLARHPTIGRHAAIKVLRTSLAENKTLVTRFVNEARAANAIHHPNIIDIIDVGTLPGTEIPYLMMELLEGETLARRIERRGRLSAAEAAEIGYQTASALGAAHTMGIVHRDLKPDNLFLVPDQEVPGRDRVKVLDFGIAKLRSDVSGDSANTQNGLLMGTPLYMSPEQCRGLVEEIDARTDIYALGVILYQMVTGVPPFMSPGVGDIIVAHLSRQPVPPRQLNPTIPVELERVILRALVKRREERQQTMLEVQNALRPVRAPTPTFEATPSPRLAPEALLTPSTHRVVDGPVDTVPPSGPHVTTFGDASGEVTPAEQQLTVSRAARSRRRVVAVGISAAGIAGLVAALAATTGPSKKHAPPGSADNAVTLAAPAATAAAPAPSAPPSPREVILKITSEPPGAAVINAETGQSLGNTPIERHEVAAPGVQRWRISKDGYRPEDIDVALEADTVRAVTLAALSEIAAPGAGAGTGAHDRKRPAAAHGTHEHAVAHASKTKTLGAELAPPPVPDKAIDRPADKPASKAASEPAAIVPARPRAEKW